MAQFKTLKNQRNNSYFDVESYEQHESNKTKEIVPSIHSEDVEGEHFSVADVLKTQLQELHKWDGSYHENTAPKQNQLLKKNPRSNNIESVGERANQERKKRDLVVKTDKYGRRTIVKSIDGGKVLVKEEHPHYTQRRQSFEDPRDLKKMRERHYEPNLMKSTYYQNNNRKKQYHEEDLDKLLDILLEDEDALDKGISEKNKNLSNGACDLEEEMLIKSGKNLSALDTNKNGLKGSNDEAKVITAPNVLDILKIISVIAMLAIVVMTIAIYFYHFS